MTAALLQEPRWVGAARALVSGCLDLRSDEERIALLEQVCRALGDELYPAFLRVLAEVGRRGDHAARIAVAQALVGALRSGRLPSGRIGGWGGVGSAAPVRSLGPLEYLCVSVNSEEGRDAHSQRQFLQAAEAVMSLVDVHDEARELYCAKLLADAAQPLEGAMTRSTRRAMEAMASAWAGGEGPALAAQRFVEALGASRPGLEPVRAMLAVR